MSPQPGTPAWFKERRRVAYREIRLLDDLNAVRRSISRLVEGRDVELDPQGEIHGALFLNAVVTYARQFVQSKEKDGNQYTFGIKRFKSVAAFDIELHKHLIDLRHKLIAHDDASILPPWLWVYGFDVESKQGKGSLVIGASVCSYALSSVTGDAFFKKIDRHVTAMIDALSLWLNEDLREFVTEAQQYPDIHKASAKDAEVHASFLDSRKTFGPNEPAKLPPIEELTTRLIQTPKGALHREEYCYRVATYSVAVGGDIRLSDDIVKVRVGGRHHDDGANKKALRDRIPLLGKILDWGNQTI